MRGALRGLVVVVVAAAVAAGVAGFYLASLLEPLAQEASAQVFVIERGAALARVTRQLEAEGLVQSRFATHWLARARGLDRKLQAGEYELSAALSASEILDRLSSGKVRTYPVVIPEGIRASEIAQRLEEAGVAEAAPFLELTSSREFAESLGIEAEGLEGYLFPETYRFPRQLPTEEVARAMVWQFKEAWAPLATDAEQSGMTMHEVVTLASIVEKETAAPEERPLIAAVFLNRLEKRMRLETDPTVIYGIANFDGNLRRRDLQDGNNPYNTYQIFGLPPGPIASPGAEALRAVLQPADSAYLYFVSKNDGTHQFSVSYRDHVNAVNRYQKRRRSK